MLNKGNLLDEMVFHRKFDLDASRLWIIFYKSIQCRPNSFDLALHLRVMVFRDGFEEDLCERVLHLFEDTGRAELLPYVSKLVKITGHIFDRGGSKAIAVEHIEVVND